ncbi:MAG: hypothetical protein HYV18_07040 [Gammaproteobacteria bacterium]|nr:hypothetical protein [Gammaproteobacteria bacterium]
MKPSRRYDLAWIAWMTGLLPIVAAHLAYGVAIAEQQTPACFPYWEGCVSISRAARHGSANFVFKALMLPYTGLLMLYWMLCWLWLNQLGTALRARRNAMLALGLVGALFLILYATFLGVKGETYEWLRRYGTTVYFSFTVLAQMLLTSLVTGDPRVPPPARHAKQGLCLAMLVLGVASIPMQHLAADRDAVVNAIEWTYALLMMAFFPFTALAWRATGAAVQVTVAIPSGGDAESGAGPAGPARNGDRQATISP